MLQFLDSRLVVAQDAHDVLFHGLYLPTQECKFIVDMAAYVSKAAAHIAEAAVHIVAQIGDPRVVEYRPGEHRENRDGECNHLCAGHSSLSLALHMPVGPRIDLRPSRSKPVCQLFLYL
jgi:hypothetical protein